MTKHTLKISFEAEEGALVRLLGLIQRRGFVVAGMTMPESAGSLKTVHLTVIPLHPSHRIEVLQKQIERLHEVREVTLGAQKTPRGVLGFLRGPAIGLQGKTVLLKENPPCLPESSSHAS